MAADDKEAAKLKGCGDPLQHRLLRRRREIDEGGQKHFLDFYWNAVVL